MGRTSCAACCPTRGSCLWHYTLFILWGARSCMAPEALGASLWCHPGPALISSDRRTRMQIVRSLGQWVVIMVVTLGAIGLSAVTSSAQSGFSSGSTGADGALVFYTPPAARYEIGRAHV